MQVIQRIAQVLLQLGCASILWTLFDTLIIINPDQSHQDRALILVLLGPQVVDRMSFSSIKFQGLQADRRLHIRKQRCTEKVVVQRFVMSHKWLW